MRPDLVNHVFILQKGRLVHLSCIFFGSGYSFLYCLNDVEILSHHDLRCVPKLSNRMILLWAIFGSAGKPPSWTCRPFDVCGPNLCPLPGVFVTPPRPSLWMMTSLSSPSTRSSFFFLSAPSVCLRAHVCVSHFENCVYLLCKVEFEGKRGNRVM